MTGGAGSGGEGNHGSDRSNSPSSQSAAAPRRTNSFKEVHPKFRKHTTPEYMTQAESVRAHKFNRQSSL